MNLRALVVALVLPLLPLPAQQAASSADCTAVAPDPARFGDAPVFAVCEVQRPAKLKRASKPNVEFPRGVSCLIAEVEFVVDETGMPVVSTAVLRNATTPAFGADVLERLGQWRYAPAERAGAPVRQLVIGRLAIQQDPRRAPFVVGGPGASPPGRASEPPCQ